MCVRVFVCACTFNAGCVRTGRSASAGLSFAQGGGPGSLVRAQPASGGHVLTRAEACGAAVSDPRPCGRLSAEPRRAHRWCYRNASSRLHACVHVGRSRLAAVPCVLPPPPCGFSSARNCPSCPARPCAVPLVIHRLLARLRRGVGCSNSAWPGQSWATATR
jgi:hypothetical protein